MTSVLTNEQANPLDITFVFIITSTANGTHARPLIATLVYDRHCASYPTGPAGAILITMGGNFLFDVGPATPTTKTIVCPWIQNDLSFLFPQPVHAYTYIPSPSGIRNLLNDDD